METLNLLFPIATGSIVVPLVAWIKAKLPGDFPLQAPVIAGILNAFIMWGLAQLLAPQMTGVEIIQLAFGAQVMSQFGHAGWKATKKITLLGEK